MITSKTMWWGYIHTNDGALHLKRYFDHRDIEDALESPFASRVIHPFEADTRGEAEDYVRDLLHAV